MPHCLIISTQPPCLGKEGVALIQMIGETLAQLVLYGGQCSAEAALNRRRRRGDRVLAGTNLIYSAWGFQVRPTDSGQEYKESRNILLL